MPLPHNTPESPRRSATNPHPLPPRTANDNSDGWTPARMRHFIDTLSINGNVARTCRECDITPPRKF